MGEKKYILGLDVSTTTIGIALFEDLGDKGKLCVLEHVSPKIKVKNITKTEELFMKANMFYDEFLGKYTNFGITKVIIEEPLLRSNNVNTVATLLRFNGILSKMIYDKLNVVPEYMSSYDSRKYAFPELMGKKDTDSKGKKLTEAAFKKKEPTLFGAYPKDADKKMIIWEKVADMEPQIQWLYNKKKELMKENLDMSDAFVVALSSMKKNGLWK
jgi:hypothetical protein